MDVTAKLSFPDVAASLPSVKVTALFTVIAWLVVSLAHAEHIATADSGSEKTTLMVSPLSGRFGVLPPLAVLAIESAVAIGLALSATALARKLPVLPAVSRMPLALVASATWNEPA